MDGGGWSALPRTAQAMTKPSKIAFDGQGRLYVADTGNARILRFDDITGRNPVALGAFGDVIVTTYAGMLRVPPVGMFNNPVGVWVNPSGNVIYVNDSIPVAYPPGAVANMVASFRLGPSGIIPSTWVGWGSSTDLGVQDVWGANDGTETGFWYMRGELDNNLSGQITPAHMAPIPAANTPGTSPATPARQVQWQNVGINYSGGIDTSAGFPTLYTSVNDLNYLVVGGPATYRGLATQTAYTNAKTKAATDAGVNYGFLSSATAGFSFGPIYGMGFDNDPPTSNSGYIYLADWWGHRVIKTLKNLSASEFATFGALGSGVGQFNGVADVKYGPDGGLYIVDKNNDRIVRIDDINGGGWTVLGASSGSDAGQFRYPHGVAYGPDGGIYVADTDNHRIIQLSDVSGTTWTEYAPTAAAHLLVAPTRVKATREGIFILDTGHVPPRMVRISDISGANRQYLVPTSTLNAPLGFDIDSAGHVFIADTGNHKIVEIDDFNEANAFSGVTYAAIGADGGGSVQGAFKFPSDIAVAPDGGMMLVADTNNNRLVKLPHPNDLNGLTTLGWQVFTPPGSAPTDFQTLLNRPGAVTFGPDGRIYVADTSNHRILRMDNFSGANLVALGTDGSDAGQFVRPSGIVVR